jgi:hypothetical protein
MDAIVHKDSCPIVIPHTTEGAVSGKVVSLAASRFDKATHPRELPALDALDAARKWAMENDAPDHVIVIFGRTMKDGCSATKFFQSGSFSHHAQMGLCMEGMMEMRDSG